VLLLPEAKADKPSLPTLADLWDGKAEFQPDGQREFGSNFGMHFLSTWQSGGRLSAYFITTADAEKLDYRLAIGLALSEDGVKFKNQGDAVLKPGKTGAWDDRMASFPGVWKEGAEAWKLVYEGAGQDARWPGDIGLATSKDGKTWTKQPKPILVHATHQADDPKELDLGWERNNIGTPSLWREGKTYYLFYHGFGPRPNQLDGCQVGVATGTDLTALVRHPKNPVLKTGAAEAWDCGTVGKRSIRKEGDYFYMAYEGSTDQPYEKARWSTGLARSKDLLTWEKYPRPILKPTETGFGNDGPEWLKAAGGALHIYYRAKGCTRRASLAWKEGGALNDVTPTRGESRIAVVVSDLRA
jgi:hypothetical protein